MRYEDWSDAQVFREAVLRAGGATDREVADRLGILHRSQVGRNRKAGENLSLQHATRDALIQWLQDHPTQEESPYERGFAAALEQVAQRLLDLGWTPARTTPDAITQEIVDLTRSGQQLRADTGAETGPKKRSGPNHSHG